MSPEVCNRSDCKLSCTKFGYAYPTLGQDNFEFMVRSVKPVATLDSLKLLTEKYHMNEIAIVGCENKDCLRLFTLEEARRFLSRPTSELS